MAGREIFLGQERPSISESPTARLKGARTKKKNNNRTNGKDPSAMPRGKYIDTNAGLFQSILGPISHAKGKYVYRHKSWTVSEHSSVLADIR